MESKYDFLNSSIENGYGWCRILSNTDVESDREK
jgi:hypothetical protein